VDLDPRELIQENGDENGDTRRSFLRGLGGTAAAAATGTTAMSDNTAAQAGSPEITVVEDGDDTASLPEVDELVIYVHGWFGNTDNFISPTPTEDMQELVTNIESDGTYSADAYVAYSWPARLGYIRALTRAEAVGERLAGLITDWRKNVGNNPRIRLIGHSLGGPVVASTLSNYDPGDIPYYGHAIDTAVMLATSSNLSAVCSDGSLKDQIDTAVSEIWNYHSFDDMLVLLNEFLGDGSSNLGFSGLTDGCEAYEWADVNCTGITSQRGAHFKYITSEKIGKNIAKQFNTVSYRPEDEDLSE
jgi:hypothetical protein